MAIMTSIDAKKGIFELKYSSGMSDEVDKVMKGISREVYLVED